MYNAFMCYKYVLINCKENIKHQNTYEILKNSKSNLEVSIFFYCNIEKCNNLCYWNIFLWFHIFYMSTLISFITIFFNLLNITRRLMCFSWFLAQHQHCDHLSLSYFTLLFSNNLWWFAVFQFFMQYDVK